MAVSKTRIVLGSCFLLASFSPHITFSQSTPLELQGFDDGDLTTIEEQEAALEYWTPERMSQAESIGMLLTEEELEEMDKLDSLLDGIGIPEKDFEAYDVQSEETVGLLAVADRYKFPHSVMGKLTSRRPDGRVSRCTAAFVGSDRQILTAAHCIHTKGQGRHTNIVFHLQYDRGGSTMEFASACNRVPYRWKKYRSREWDFAIIRVRNASPNGHLGLSLKEWTQVRSTGYPINIDNTEVMHTFRGKARPYKHTRLQMKANPMGKGSSGGPWINNYNNVFGLNSFLVPGKKGSFSPKLWGPLNESTSHFREWYNRATKKCRRAVP